jgi:hypothetical protein
MFLGLSRSNTVMPALVVFKKELALSEPLFFARKWPVYSNATRSITPNTLEAGCFERVYLPAAPFASENVPRGGRRRKLVIYASLGDWALADSVWERRIKTGSTGKRLDIFWSISYKYIYTSFKDKKCTTVSTSRLAVAFPASAAIYVAPLACLDGGIMKSSIFLLP